MDDLNQILDELQKPLPDSTVTRQNQNASNLYFKNDVYEWWARKHAGSLFSSEIKLFEVTEQYVKFIVRIYIGQTYHEGAGFKIIDASNSLTTCVDLAREEAERNAFDMFGFGWYNLGKYQTNRIPVNNDVTTGVQTCIKCTLQLEESDLLFLKRNPNIKHPYHKDCTPSHLIKNG